jgi:hypothetical protein
MQTEKITFDTIYSEYQLNLICIVAQQSGVTVEINAPSTSVVLSGTGKQILKFCKLFTSQ